MEITFDYLREHLSEFVVDTTFGQDCANGYGYWNSFHGLWMGNKSADMIPNIKYVFAIMPYLDNDTISGNKVVKGFIIVNDNKVAFTSEDSLNKYFHKYYGHTVYEAEDGYDYASTNCKYANDFRMFTTREEAKEALKSWVHQNELTLYKNELCEVDKKLDDLRNQLKGQEKRREEILKKLNKIANK